MRSSLAVRHVIRSSVVIAAVAFFTNVPWEFAHSVLYDCFPDGNFSKSAYIAMHFRAAAGDVGLTLLLLLGGALLTRSTAWWIRLSSSRIATLVVAGALLATAIEVHAVVLTDRWTYAASMPTVFGIGVTPVLQMAILPVLTFALSRRLLGTRDVSR